MYTHTHTHQNCVYNWPIDGHFYLYGDLKYFLLDTAPLTVFWLVLTSKFHYLTVPNLENCNWCLYINVYILLDLVFLADFCGFTMNKIMLSVKKYILLFNLFYLYLSYCTGWKFRYSIVNSGEDRQACLVPLERKVSLNMLTVDFFSS